MNKSAFLLSVALVASISLLFSSCAGIAEQRRTRALEIDVSIDPAQLADGVYEGLYAYASLEYRALVTLRSGRMVDIVVEANKEAPRASLAMPIVASVMAENSLAVDVVAGATTSSKAILKAIENALRRAPLR